MGQKRRALHCLLSIRRMAMSVCLSDCLSVGLFVRLSPRSHIGRHQGCHRCSLPREKLPTREEISPMKFMFAAGAYSWRPWKRHTCCSCFRDIVVMSSVVCQPITS